MAIKKRVRKSNNEKGRPKIQFDKEQIEKMYADHKFHYIPLAQKLKVNKDTLLTFLKANNLYKPSQPSKLKTMSGINEASRERTPSRNGTVSMREYMDMEDYVDKWKRKANEEEAEKRNLEKENADLKRKIDTWEDKKEIEIEKLRAEIRSDDTKGLNGLTNPDVLKGWAELAATIAPVVMGLKGGTNAGEVSGPNADTIKMVADIFSKVDADTANKLSTVVQAYAQPMSKSYLDALFNQIMASAK